MNSSKTFLRFTLPMRLEHWAITISFALLLLTGIPQKFVDADISQTIIRSLGGIEATRNIHHIAAIVLCLIAIYHVVTVAYKLAVLRVRWTMFPHVDDVMQAIDTLRYDLGLAKERPQADRYTFAEKVSYWTIVWGIVVMIASGFILLNPITTARFLPGDWILSSKATHGAEAILLVIIVVVWHLYDVVFKAFNRVAFTGKLTELEMEREHALELKRIRQGQLDALPTYQEKTKRERVFVPVAAIASILMLGILYLLATAEPTSPTTVVPQTKVQVFAPITVTPMPRGGTSVASGSMLAKPLATDHEGRTTCLACHANLPQPAMPADHAGRTEATCMTCHKTGGAVPVVASASTTQAPSSTAPSATATPAATKASPTLVLTKDLTATHAGRTMCLSCHATLAQPKMPANHADRTDRMCWMCHRVAGGSSAATPAGAATKTSSGSAKVLPADHAGRTICVACHANLPQPAMPADHAGRTDATCVACHPLP